MPCWDRSSIRQIRVNPTLKRCNFKTNTKSHEHDPLNGSRAANPGFRAAEITYVPAQQDPGKELQRARYQTGGTSNRFTDRTVPVLPKRPQPRENAAPVGHRNFLPRWAPAPPATRSRARKGRTRKRRGRLPGDRAEMAAQEAKAAARERAPSFE